MTDATTPEPDEETTDLDETPAAAGGKDHDDPEQGEGRDDAF